MNLQILEAERQKYFRAVKRLFTRPLESTALLRLPVWESGEFVGIGLGRSWKWQLPFLRLDTDADGGITATEFEVPSVTTFVNILAWIQQNNPALFCCESRGHLH